MHTGIIMGEQVISYNMSLGRLIIIQALILFIKVGALRKACNVG